MSKNFKLDDSLLEVLGDYFVTHDLVSKGWTFEQFVAEWFNGNIVMERAAV